MGPKPFQMPVWPSSRIRVARPDDNPVYFAGLTYTQKGSEGVRCSVFGMDTDLHVALGDVERGDAGVGDAACEDTAEHAF